MAKSFPDQGFWRQLVVSYGKPTAYLKGFDRSLENWNSLAVELTRKGKTRNLCLKPTR